MDDPRIPPIMLARRFVRPFVAIMFVACHESTAPDPRIIPTSLQAVTATALTGMVGNAVQPTPSVRVANSSGEPISNVEVHFAVGDGNGSVQSAAVRTDAQGIATAGSWTMGTATGSNTLLATVAGLPTVSFSATASAGPPAGLALVSGDAQSDTTHSTLLPIVVRVTDGFGNVVPSATVEVVIAADAGTIAPAAPTTGPDGQTQLRWTLGGTAGPQTARVQLPGLVSTAFILHATTRWPQVLATTFSTGLNHNCAVLENRRLFCWGDNSFGQIGDGTTEDRPVGVPISDGTAFTQVAAGGVHTCALTAAGQTLCWGTNRWGQLGDGSTVDHATPAPVTGVPAFTQLVAGGEHVCGRTAGGEVYCWGFMLGATVSGQPTLVSGASHFQSIASGYYLTCGADDAGATQCFVGTTTPEGFAWRPQPVLNAPRLVAFAGGLNFMCGVTSVGAAYCWGNNDYGQLGNGTSDSSATPVAVASGQAFRSIHSGYDFACGITLADEAYCWGHAAWGTLGVENGPQILSIPARLPVAAGLKFTSLAGGFYHMCGLATTSVVQCWGGGFDGQLGDGASSATVQFYHRATPAPALRH